MLFPTTRSDAPMSAVTVFCYLGVNLELPGLHS